MGWNKLQAMRYVFTDLTGNVVWCFATPQLDQAGYREGSGSGDSEDGGEVDKLWGQRRASESGCSLAVTEEELTHEARNRVSGDRKVTVFMLVVLLTG